MAKNKFNSMVGLTGFAGTSNLIGSYAGLLDGTVLSGSTGGSMFSTTTSTTTNSLTTSLNSLNSKLSALQQERMDLSAKIVACETELARLSAARGGCKRTFGWDNGCLDTNTRLANEQNALKISYQNRIAQIDLEIPKLQADMASAQKAIQDALVAEATAAKAAAEAEATRLQAEAAKITAQAMANPENMQIQAQMDLAVSQAKAAADALLTESSTEKSKMMMFLGAGIVVVLIIAGMVMYIFKK